MPEKLGNGGHGLENYDPATGKYIEDGQLNSSYNNPSEKIGNKELEATTQQITFLKNFFSTNNIDIENVKRANKKVSQAFSDSLRRKMNSILGMEHQDKTKDLIFNEIINALEDTDDNTRKLCMRAIKNVSSIYDYGANWFQRFDGDISLTFSALDFTKKSCNYVKNGVFFHEFGHALDNLIMYNLDDDIGGYDPFYSPYASEHFISEKYGKNMFDMLVEEFSSLDLDEIRKEELNYVYDEALPHVKNKEDLNNECKKNTDELFEEEGKMIDVINQRLEFIFNKNDENDAFSLTELDDDFVEKDDDIYGTIKINDFIGVRTGQNWTMFLDKNRMKEFKEKLAKIREEFKQNKELSSIVDRLRTIKEKRKKLKEIVANIENNKTRVWRAFSDTFESVTGDRLSCNAGHGDSYWRAESFHRPCELFAQLLSGKVANPKSYDIYKKYCPKTVEIFEELLEYAGGRM